MKWISLLLWAGADPYVPGPGECCHELSEGEKGISALAYAALYGHFEVFNQRKIRLTPGHPGAREVLRYGCRREGIEIVKKLLRMGMNPNDQENGGCSVIQSLLESMSWEIGRHPWGWEFGRRLLDTEESREEIKAVHLLVKHGARWMPADIREINSARRSLLKLVPDYTVEFVWIMAKYQACTFESIHTLLRTPSIKSHISRYAERVQELLSSWAPTMPAGRCS